MRLVDCGTKDVVGGALTLVILVEEALWKLETFPLPEVLPSFPDEGFEEALEEVSLVEESREGEGEAEERPEEENPKVAVG